jgi:hypothetical protein
MNPKDRIRFTVSDGGSASESVSKMHFRFPAVCFLIFITSSSSHTDPVSNNGLCLMSHFYPFGSMNKIFQFKLNLEYAFQINYLRGGKQDDDDSMDEETESVSKRKAPRKSSRSSNKRRNADAEEMGQNDASESLDSSFIDDSKADGARESDGRKGDSSSVISADEDSASENDRDEGEPPFNNNARVFSSRAQHVLKTNIFIVMMT